MNNRYNQRKGKDRDKFDKGYDKIIWDKQKIKPSRGGKRTIAIDKKDKEE